MKILFTWELGSSPVHLHHMNIIAHALRRKVPGCKLVLASTQPLSASQALPFDEVFVTNRLQFKHSNDATGTLSALNHLGWTTPELRSLAFSGWAQLYRQQKPDLVITEASPGALLSAVLEGIPVIQSSNGQYQVSQEEQALNEHFPEFQQWLWCLTGRTYAQLLAQPGMVFAPRSADVTRPGMIFHVNPAQWTQEYTQMPSVQALIYDDHGDFQELPRVLAEEGISSLRAGLTEAVNTVSVAAVFGHFDPYSVSVAVSCGALYFGKTPSPKHEAFAERCLAQKIAHTLPDEQALAVLIDSHVQAPRAHEFLGVEQALSYLLPKTAP